MIERVNELPEKSPDRRTFMRLPLEKRRRILAAQAEAMIEHYEQNTEWQDWVTFDSGVSNDEF